MNAPASPGDRLARAAAEFIGVPFRLHGRDPVRGLDCVGLVYASLAAIGREARAPAGYRLRNADPAQWFSSADEAGFAAIMGGLAPGDLVLVEPGPGQQHLVIAECQSVAIHAHAGLGRVVRQPMRLSARPRAHWRLT